MFQVTWEHLANYEITPRKDYFELSLSLALSKGFLNLRTRTAQKRAR